MAVVTFSRPVAFPTALLRNLLSQHLPLYRWQCGEEDMGGANEVGGFRPHDIITGRSADTVIFIELHSTLGHFEAPAPLHKWHLLVGEPTTELKTIADRITLIICSTVMVEDEREARCQLKAGGNWLGIEDLTRALKLVVGGEDIKVADGLGVPPEALAHAVEPMPARPGPAVSPVSPPESPAVDEALRSTVVNVSPDIRRIVGLADPSPPAFPVRRPGGFGRKGL